MGEEIEAASYDELLAATRSTCEELFAPESR
jgi:hypothetical protein